MSSIPATRAAISALKIEERVERDVKAGIPEIDRNSHTESEESLRSYVVREIIGRVHQGRQEEIDAQADTRGEVEIRQLYQQIKNTEATLNKQVSAKFSAIVRELQRLARDFSTARMDLESFRHRNGLTREAVYRESRILHYSVVFFIVIVETALNAFFLAKGSELGLVGGFFQALIISLVNLGLAAFAAFALRQSFHISALRKALFLGLFVFVGAISVFFILGVGHYREALELHPFTASKVAVMNLWGAPLGIHDFNSWIMVIVSGMALILLTAKFFIVEDHYPGYTAVARRARERRERWIRGCSAAFEEIGAVVEEAQRALSEREKAIRSQYIGFKSSIDRSEDIRREYEEDIVKAQGLLDELVRYYQSYSARMMNRRAAYFGELLRFELDKLPKLNTVGLEQHKEDLAYFDQVMAELDREYADAMELVSGKWGEFQEDIRAAIAKIERENGLGGL